jgi:flavin-dependent dehydrogenase
MEADVLVVGAGPAGSTLALRLAREGIRVALADAKQFPRDKPCGEFVGPGCLPLLAELGLLAELLRCGPHPVAGLALHGFGVRAEGRFESAATGLGIRRERLDALLLRAAAAEPGVQWLPAHRFVALLHARDGRVIGARFADRGRRDVALRARFVIGADGVHSRVARALALSRPLRWLDRFALVTHYAGVAPRALAEVHFVERGYFAATNVDGRTFALNLVLDRAALRARSGPDDLVADRLRGAPPMAERLAAAERIGRPRGIGPLAFTTRRQVGRGFALVGDAAGYVDPLTGEGIYFALWGARRLAAALLEAIRDPAREAAALRAYAAGRRREIAPRLFLARLLQRGLRWPPLAATVLRALTRWPALADRLVTVTGDALHPRDLLRPREQLRDKMPH